MVGGWAVVMTDTEDEIYAMANANRNMLGGICIGSFLLIVILTFVVIRFCLSPLKVAERAILKLKDLDLSKDKKIQKYVNEQYECCSNKKFMKVLETIARMNGNEEVYIEDMYACNKEARNYYLSELMMCFNFVFNEMCHGTGSAAGCDFNNEEE